MIQMLIIIKLECLYKYQTSRLQDKEYYWEQRMIVHIDEKVNSSR